MKVGVTGGGGFVGGHVYEELVKAGHQVVLMDVRRSAYVKGGPSGILGNAVKYLDVLDPIPAERFRGFNVVMHLAAVSNTQQAMADPRLATELNCVGTVNVLEAAVSAGVKRVVIAGSSLVSGLQEPDETGWVDEDSPFHLDWGSHPYVTSKMFAEQIARDYGRSRDIDVTVLRYGIQYGPCMTPGVVVHSFIERALAGKPLMVHGTGSQWRQYVYVGDVARAHAMVLEHWDASKGETFNLVSDRKVTILDIAEAVTDVVDVPILHAAERPGDILVTMCRSERALKKLGWSADVSLEDGIARTIDWYRRNGAA